MCMHVRDPNALGGAQWAQKTGFCPLVYPSRETQLPPPPLMQPKKQAQRQQIISYRGLVRARAAQKRGPETRALGALCLMHLV